MKLFSILGMPGQPDGGAMSGGELRAPWLHLPAPNERAGVPLACHCPSGSTPVRAALGAV